MAINCPKTAGLNSFTNGISHFGDKIGMMWDISLCPSVWFRDIEIVSIRKHSFRFEDIFVPRNCLYKLDHYRRRFLPFPQAASAASDDWFGGGQPAPRHTPTGMGGRALPLRKPSLMGASEHTMRVASVPTCRWARLGDERGGVGLGAGNGCHSGGHGGQGRK
jgi:hypothetical protein